MILQALRSAVFYLCFFIYTAIFAIIIGVMSKLTPTRREAGWAVARVWNTVNMVLLRWIVGIRSEVSGSENIPQGGCIIASKHQSDWDIFAVLPYLEKPAYIAKKELLDIPFFGWAARWIYTIPVDRKRGKESLPAMLAEAKDRAERGCRIVIYPEGTRRAPLEDPAYRWGIARMYENLNVPVVPVALTSGLYWGRNSLILWPGKARARFLPAIAPGLDQDTFMDTLITMIETETNRMTLEDAREGLARPISPRLRQRLAELEAEIGSSL